MSGRPPPRRRLLSASDRLYRGLLFLYPADFRRQFGSQIAQAFLDACQQAQSEHGLVAVLGLWPPMVLDLAASVFQEHLSPEGHMSRTTFARLAGATALLGGVLLALSFMTHPQGLARAIVPGSVVCLLMGLLGLHARLWGREGRLGWLGFGLAGVGLALGFIGMGGSAVGILDPNPLAPIINTGEHAGLVFIGAGMLLWGIVTLREKALGRWSVLPLVMSLFGLSGIVFLVPAAFAALEHSAMPEVFGVLWMFLGFALLTTRANPPAVPARSAAA